MSYVSVTALLASLTFLFCPPISDANFVSANFGQALRGYHEGDIDGDGTIGFPDFLVLSANFGQTSSGSLSAVPEPSGCALWMLGVTCLGLLRRHRIAS